MSKLDFLTWVEGLPTDEGHWLVEYTVPHSEKKQFLSLEVKEVKDWENHHQIFTSSDLEMEKKLIFFIGTSGYSLGHLTNHWYQNQNYSDYIFPGFRIKILRSAKIH